jgi:uncharacterized protein (DUF983 family)
MMLALQRSWRKALWRGFKKSCPACGEGALMKSYITVNASCSHCGEDLHHQRADDAPPYFTMFIVGHTIVPLLLLVEKKWSPELWVHFILWLPLTLLMTLVLLPMVKGATVGLQWALGMHGFAGENDKPTGP